MVGVNELLSLAEVQFNEMEDKIKGNMTQYRFSMTIESACKAVDPKFPRGCTYNVRLDWSVIKERWSLKNYNRILHKYNLWAAILHTVINK